MLSEKQIENFRQLHRARFGAEISKEEALESGLSLISLIKAVLKARVNDK